MLRGGLAFGDKIEGALAALAEVCAVEAAKHVYARGARLQPRQHLPHALQHALADIGEAAQVIGLQQHHHGCGARRNDSARRRQRTSWP